MVSGVSRVCRDSKRRPHQHLRDVGLSLNHSNVFMCIPTGVFRRFWSILGPPTISTSVPLFPLKSYLFMSS